MIKIRLQTITLNNRKSRIILQLRKAFLLKECKMSGIYLKKDLKKQETNIKTFKLKRLISLKNNKKLFENLCLF